LLLEKNHLLLERSPLASGERTTCYQKDIHIYLFTAVKPRVFTIFFVTLYTKKNTCYSLQSSGHLDISNTHS
jgi:hypothetical protein